MRFIGENQEEVVLTKFNLRGHDHLIIRVNGQVKLVCEIHADGIHTFNYLTDNIRSASREDFSVVDAR